MLFLISKQMTLGDLVDHVGLRKIPILYYVSF